MARLDTSTNIGLQYTNPFDNIAKWSANVSNDLIEQERLQRQKDQDAYQKNRDLINDKRWDIQNSRTEEEYTRKKKEQQATDAFYNSMAEGTKQVGGLYGDMLSKESDKYALTQAEIASGIVDPTKARSVGNEAFAKKLEWQLDAGETANKAVTADAFKESRPEMFLRIIDETRAKGLPVLPGMVEKYESAKLAEETASAKKLEDVTKLKEDIYKDQLSNSKFLINTLPSKNGEIQSGIDSEGNPIYIPTLKQQVNSQNKANKTFDEQVADDTKILNSVFDDLKKDGKPVTLEKGTADAIRSDMSKAYIDARNNYPNVDPTVIAKAVASTAGSTSGGYLWGDPEAKYNVEELNNKLKDSAFIKSETDKIKSQQQVALQNSGSDSNIPSKYDMAKELVYGTNAVNANRLAGINSKMSQLNMTPEERRIAKAQEWLRSEGLVEPEQKDRFEEFNPKNRLSLSGKNSSEIGFKNAVAEVESGGDYNAVNKDSNAKGKYQFVDSTLNGLIKQSGNNHTIDQVMKSPELQEYYFDKLTVRNKNDLISRGIQPNDFNMWLAHNLGPARAENFLSGEPLTKSTIRAIDANIGSGFAPTRENYLNKFGSKFAGAPKEIKSYDDDTSVAQKDSKVVNAFNPIPDNGITKNSVLTEQTLNSENEKFKEPDRIGDLLSQKKNILKSDISLDEKEKEISKINLELKNSTKQDVGFLENTSSKLNNIIKGKPASINPLLQPITSSIDFMISSGVRDVNFVKDNVAIPLGNLLKEKSLTADEKNEIQKIIEDLLPNKKFMESITPRLEGRTNFSNVSEESKQLSNYFANPYPNDFDKSLVSDLYRNVNLYRLK